MGGAKAAHIDHIYICPLNFVIKLDPGIRVGKMAYVLSMDELISTQEILVEIAGV